MDFHKKFQDWAKSINEKIPYFNDTHIKESYKYDNLKEIDCSKIIVDNFISFYKTKTSVLNADVNGSLNILRKYLKVSSDLVLPIGSRGLVTRPLIVNIKNQKY